MSMLAGLALASGSVASGAPCLLIRGSSALSAAVVSPVYEPVWRRKRRAASAATCTRVCAFHRAVCVEVGFAAGTPTGHVQVALLSRAMLQNTGFGVPSAATRP